MAIRLALLGMVVAAVAVACIHLPFPAQSRLALALFLALTACVYLGALLAHPQRWSTLTVELTVGGLVFACSFLGMAASPAWLAAGYALHGGWDWLHHIRV